MPSRSILDSFAELAIRPTGRAATAALLRQTEVLSGPELERHQLLRAERLVEHARTTVAYYADLPALPTAGLTLEHWHKLPVLDRETLRERASELVSREIPAEHRIVREVSSSGSTGRHVTVKIDAVGAAITNALALRDHAWHGRDLTLKAAAIRAIPSGAAAPHGRREKNWSAHPQSGPLALLDVHTPVREQLDWLLREAPAYIATYASNAAALLALAEQERVTWPDLRELGTFGEVVDRELREAARRAWQVPLVDAYSTVELGYLALQCPKHEHYHAQSEHVLVELLREDGTPCEPGETGRVVATALHAFAMPLIRYAVGDYAIAGKPCDCGRGLPVLERILGRARNMLRLPSGDVLWPRYGSIEIGKLFPLRQFRLIQMTLSRLSLELVVTRPLNRNEEQRLRAFVLDTLRYPFELELCYVDSIPRSPSGKFEDFVSEIAVTGTATRPARSGC